MSSASVTTSRRAGATHAKTPIHNSARGVQDGGPAVFTVLRSSGPMVCSGPVIAAPEGSPENEPSTGEPAVDERLVGHGPLTDEDEESFRRWVVAYRAVRTIHLIDIDEAQV